MHLRVLLIQTTMNLSYFCLLIVFMDATVASVPKNIIKEVETNLESLFGFKSRPNLDKSRIIVPRAMVEMYEKQTGLPFVTATIPRRGLNTRNANTVRSFLHIGSHVDTRFPSHHKFRLNFNVSGIPKEEVLKAAELALNRQLIDRLVEQNSADYYQTVMVNDIIKPGIKLKHGPIMRLIDTKVIDTRKNTTLSLDVLPAVKRWFQDPSSNYGLLVVVSRSGSNKTLPEKHVILRRDVEDELTWNKVQPVLYTYTDDGRYEPVSMTEMSQRPKRATTRKQRRKENKAEPCRRYSMYVDFSEVGWSDWIVAPPGYDAFYCHGECSFPLADHLNTTNHAIVQTLMNSVSPSKYPKACCVPTQLAAISMLYLDDENKVVLKNYKEMVVNGCGCR